MVQLINKMVPKCSRENDYERAFTILLHLLTCFFSSVMYVFPNLIRDHLLIHYSASILFFHPICFVCCFFLVSLQKCGITKCGGRIHSIPPRFAISAIRAINMYGPFFNMFHFTFPNMKNPFVFPSLRDQKDV